VIKKIVILTVAIIVGFLFSEMCLRVYHRILPIRYISAYKLFTYNKVFGNWHKSNVKVVWRQENRATITTNSYGLIGKACKQEKPAGVFRIAVVGDSFTEAVQVSPEKNFCSQLEKVLNEQSSSGVKYEVLNFGVSGQGTGQEYLVLQHMAMAFQPDVVILAFFPQNDFRNNVEALQRDTARPYFIIDRQKQLSLDPVMQNAFEDFVNSRTTSLTYRLANALRDRSYIAIVGFEVLKYLKSKEKTPLFEQTSERVERIPIFGPPQTAPWFNAWDVTEALIQEMNHYCRTQGIPFVMVQVTSPEQINDQNYRNYMRNFPGDDVFYVDKRMSQFCASNNIYYVPLAKKFSELEVQDPLIYFHGFRGPRKPESGHWNEHGHYHCAKILAEFLCEQKIVNG
jgi:hypothetical protein